MRLSKHAAVLAGLAAMCCAGAPRHAVAQPMAPANDLCSAAVVLAPNTPVYGSNVTANSVLDGPAAPCAAGSNFHAVWFTFTPTASERFQIQASGTRFDSVLTVYESVDCTGFSDDQFVVAPGGCNNDQGGGIPGPGATGLGSSSLISNIPLTANHQYWIRLSSASSVGQYQVAVFTVSAFGACCSGTGVCTLTMPGLCPSVDATSYFLGTGSVCTPTNPCSGACCNNTTLSCTVTLPGTGTGGCGTTGTWQGYRTTCTATTCQTGACCTSGAVCTLTAQNGCATASSWQAGVTCGTASAQCYPLGACCTSGGACSLLTSGTACASGATFQGLGTTCVSTTCVSGACCTTAGVCSVVQATGCTGTSRWNPASSCSSGACTQACCSDTTFACAVSADAACPAGSTSIGLGTACTPGVCDSGACCSSTGVCTLVVSRLCAAANQFAGLGTVCVPSVCTAACCNIYNGSCVVAAMGTLAGCTTAGVFSTCAAAPCGGACCTAAGACSIAVNASTCTGTYLGSSTACSPNPCMGACCNGTSCALSLAGSCAGVFSGAGTTCTYKAPVLGSNAIEDISAATDAIQLTLGGDASSLSIPLPFTFRFFGTVKSDLLINTNGWLSFNTTGTQPNAIQASTPTVPLGSAVAAPNDFVAVLWRDLVQTANQNPPYTIGYVMRGTAPQRRFVVMWRVGQFGSNALTTMEAILYEGSDAIELRYGTFSVTNNDTAFGVGLENAAGTSGFNVPATTVIPGSSIFFRPAASCGAVAYPGGVCCVQTVCSVGNQGDCQSMGGVFDASLSSCSPSPCVTGACCSVTNGCTVGVPAVCINLNGAYQGDSTTCSSNPCPTGACCATGGACSMGSQASCIGASGVYQGDASVCNAATCHAGACCAAAGACSVVLQSICLAANSEYKGDGSGCSPVPCVTGRCCVASGACSVVIHASCQGDWTGGGSCTVNLCQGACCGAGACLIKTAQDCGVGGTGVYTAGGVCSPNPCLSAVVTMCESFDFTAPGSLPGEWNSSVFGNGSIWTVVSDQSYTPTRSIFASSAEPNGARTLALPPFTAAGSVVLNFRSRYAMEDIFGDGWIVQASINGADFANIGRDAWTLNGYSPGVMGVLNSFIGGEPAFTGSSASTLTWTERTAVIPAEYNDLVTIRFAVCSDITVASTGVWLDDVCVGNIRVGNGACCANNGACTSTTRNACTNPSLFQGIGSVCSASGGACPNPGGACCNAYTICTYVTGGQCASGSTYSGNGTVCSPNSCPGTPGICQNFDLTALGVLPAGWSSVVTGAAPSAPNWTVVGTQFHTSGRAVYTTGVNHVQSQFLTLPPVTAAGPLILDFWRYYSVDSATFAYDGWSVEVSVNGGAFANIQPAPDAPNPFTLNGYNSIISAAFGNEIGGQPAFSLDARIWTQSTATIPAAPGDLVIVRFRMSEDNGVAPADSGVWLDDICIANVQTQPIGGICCRGATCSTAFATAAACEAALNTISSTVHSSFVAGVSVCNSAAIPPATVGNARTPCCYANYNHNTTIEVQDIFDFLNDWFAGKKATIPGGDGDTGNPTVQNIFDFLNAWFAGCS